MPSLSAPVRTLFVIDELDIGGTEQQIFELVTRLDRHRFTPLVCCFRPGRVSAEIEAAGVPVFVLPKRAVVDVRLVWRLVRLMRRERIGLLQTYLFTANTWARLAGIIARVPVIVTSERNVDIWEQDAKRIIGRWLDHWTHRTSGNSEAVVAYLAGKGVPRDKLRVIYNGVDTTRFEEPVAVAETKAELGIPPHHSVVCMLARLEPQKDPRVFLQAAAMLAGRMPAVSFLVVGGGSLRADLEREAETLGIRDRVIFTGPRRDVHRLLAACDVSVNSSLKEGMSNTIMESMAAGKPVVATTVGGNPELVQEGETGFLVPPREVGALAHAIERILDDPQLAKTMGLQARARIMQRFSVNAMVDETQRLYDEVSRVETRPRGAVPGGDGTRRTVGLVASQFPRHVDAYFLREISALAARGVRFRIFSLRTFKSDIVHAAARPFVADTVYVPFVLSWPLLRANGRFLRRDPGRYLRTLAEVVSGCLSRPRSLLLSIAVFPKSVYFAELAEQEGLAHIHANWASHPAASALVMSMLTGIPWSFAGHASDIYVDGSMLRDKIRAAKFVVTCTRHNKDYLVGIGGSDTRDKITVSYHGVDLDRFKPDPSARGDRFTILTAGTLRKCKGLPDLIEACRILADRGISFVCSIVGDGEERRPLERLIRSKGLEDRIRITGYLAQEQIIPLYQQADVVVLPALSESHFGIPNILLEAFAVETPVICTPLISLDEVMKDGVHGLYIPERDPRALADALATLAGDPARCRAMGAAGRRQIEALFDSDKNVTTLLALFRDAVESSSLRTPLSLEAISPTRSRLREES